MKRMSLHLGTPDDHHQEALRKHGWEESMETALLELILIWRGDRSCICIGGLGIWWIYNIWPYTLKKQVTVWHAWLWWGYPPCYPTPNKHTYFTILQMVESVFRTSMSCFFQFTVCIFFFSVLYAFAFEMLFLCLRFCYSLAVAGNNRATRLLCCPSPHWSGEENRKKKAKTHVSG